MFLYSLFCYLGWILCWCFEGDTSTDEPPVQQVPGVLSPGVKARPGRDADHSPPSSAEVVNEYELYLLSPQAPAWRVAGLHYLFTYIDDKSSHFQLIPTIF
jgi:hypothetical protein